MKELKTEMLTMSDYMKQRGITEEDMREAERRTQAHIDAYNCREACKERRTTQAQTADDDSCKEQGV
ncbi:MAG: hypothetical protein ACI361_05085 [Atopobiaceae bacterium]